MLQSHPADTAFPNSLRTKTKESAVLQIRDPIAPSTAVTLVVTTSAIIDFSELQTPPKSSQPHFEQVEMTQMKRTQICSLRPEQSFVREPGFHLNSRTFPGKTLQIQERNGHSNREWPRYCREVYWTKMVRTTILVKIRRSS